MVSKITDGIQVSVETYYQTEFSDPTHGEYMFAYQVSIYNHNNFPVKLLRRHWYIFDSNGEQREVEGEGVVGVRCEEMGWLLVVVRRRRGGRKFE